MAMQLRDFVSVIESAFMWEKGKGIRVIALSVPHKA
jgi:hypothetical protein